MALVGDTFEYFDHRFRAMTVPTAELEVLYDGCRWAEGPVWFNDGGFLVWSDIPNNRMLRWTPDQGVGAFRANSNFANGNTRDREGRLVTCEHGGRRVTRTEPDGSLTVIADSHDGRRLNSPNDVVVKSDGTIWFTDPPYGILSDYEGNKGETEIGGCHVYCVDPASGSIRIVADDFTAPNGLAFSPDERRLYVTDTMASPRHVRVFDVNDDNTLSGGGIWATATNGGFDGFRFDEAGRIWMSAADGVHCLHPDGTLIGKVLVPELTANVVFGGRKRNRLFICGTTSLYSILLPVNGVKTF